MRQNKIGIIVGKRGTGKTYFTKEVIKKARPEKVLIVDTVDHPSYSEYQIIKIDYLKAWRSGIKRVIVNDRNFDTFCELANKYLRNCLIVFEDAAKYVIGYVPDGLARLLLDTKQKNIDVLMLYHGFGDVAPKLFRYSNFVTVMKTNENIKSYKGKIPNFDMMQKVWQMVQDSSNPYENKTVEL